MSDLLGEYSPLTGLSSEDALQAQKDMYARSLKGVNAALSVPATLLAPDLHLTDMTGGPKFLNYVPGAGAVEGIAGLGGAILNAGSDLGNLVAHRYGVNIPRVPTGAAQHFEATRSNIKDLIGQYTPLTAPDMTNEADQYTDLAGSVLGSLIPIAPGSIANAVPRGLQTATGMLLPSAEHLGRNAVVGAGFGTLAAGSQVAKDAMAVQPNLNDYLALQDKQEQQPAAVAPPPTQPGSTPDISTGLNTALSGAEPPPGPTFGEEGASEHSVLDALFTIGGIITAIGAAKWAHGIRGAATDMERTARFNDPVYAQKSADYNNAVIKRGGPDISQGLDPPEPPPLPEANRFRQATNAANTQVLDSNAQMMDAIRVISEPQAADRLAHMYGNIHSDAGHEVRMDNFNRTGLDEQTGIRVPPPADLYRDISRLTEDEQLRLNSGMNALNELDNRVKNARAFQQQNPGATPTANDLRHDFADKDDMQLRLIATQMQNDPRLSGIATRFRGITDGMLDIGEGHGFFTSQEVKDIKATHPNYVPEVGPNGETLHPFGPRATGVMTGTQQVNSRSWYNLAQHVEELHRQFELNAANKMLWESQTQAQRQFSNSAQFMTEVRPNTANTSFYGNERGQFRDPIIAIRTSSGPKYVRVEHPDFYNAMTGDSLKKRTVARDLLTIPRRLYQQGTTGAISALTGRLYPPVNAAYTSMLMATNAPRHMYGGLVDKLTQRLTGQTSGISRGVDMVTNLPYVGASYLRGVADRRINNVADLLRPDSNSLFARTLQPILGNATVQAMQQSLKNYYLQSATNRIRQMGIGGMGSPIKSDLPALGIVSNKQSRLVAARNVPDLFFSGKWMGTKPFFLKLNRVIQEAMTNMSDAGHDAFARLNMGNPNINKETLAYETRQLTGDPGTHGDSAIVRGISGALPYTNVSAQGSARFGRALAGGTAPMTLATGLGTIALASILTHMRSAAHIDYLQNEVSTQQRAGNIILGTNDDPHKPTMIPLSQEFRLPYALALDLMSKAVNLIAVKHDPDIRNNTMEMIKDFLGSHIMNSSEDSMVHGAVDAYGILNLPPYFGQIDYDKMIYGKSIVDSYRPLTTPDRTLPNQTGDGILDDKNGKVWNSIIRSVFGMIGTAVSGADNITRYAKQTGSWVDALGMAGHDWVQGFKDKNPQGNILWENAVRLSTQPPIVEHMQRKIDALEKVTGSRTEEAAEGTTGRGRYSQPVPTGENTKIPTEPTMRRMYQVADAYRSRMTGPLEEISAIRKQMGAVDQQGMDPDTRRKWMNDRTRDLADKYRVIGSYVADMEHMLSRVAGKPIKIENVDFSKGPEQFN